MNSICAFFIHVYMFLMLYVCVCWFIFLIIERFWTQKGIFCTEKVEKYFSILIYYYYYYFFELVLFVVVVVVEELKEW